MTKVRMGNIYRNSQDWVALSGPQISLVCLEFFFFFYLCLIHIQAPSSLSLDKSLFYSEK